MGKGRRAAIGGGLFGGAAMFALYGVGLLIALAVVALDLAWPPWLAVVIVAVIVFAAACIAALLSKRQLTTATRVLQLARLEPVLPALAAGGGEQQFGSVATGRGPVVAARSDEVAGISARGGCVCSGGAASRRPRPA